MDISNISLKNTIIIYLHYQYLQHCISNRYIMIDVLDIDTIYLQYWHNIQRLY